MINKKMILLISTMLCGSFGVMVAAQALTAEQNKVYQGLVAKFQANQLTAEDNTIENVVILTQQEAFLAQAVKAQATKKQSLLPYWLAASVGPTIRMTYQVGKAFGSLSYKLWSNSQPCSKFVGHVGDLLQKPVFWPYNINDALGLPKDMLSTLVYTVAPAVAFYGIYKMYFSLKSQQEEVETVRDVLAALAIFGAPSSQ
jgi:hypothetical protein